MRHPTGQLSAPSPSFTSPYLLSKLLAACVLLISFSSLAFCQEATIVGTVTDPSGAVVPSVKVIATNTDKNQSTDITTNESGQFAFSSLGIGHYTVKAEVSGFKTFEQNDIVLEVGDRTRVDVKLQVGNTKESVTVEAAAIAVQSESGEVSDVITGKEMTQLATNGRSIYALTTLTAGASSNMSDFSAPTSIGGDASVSFNGLRENHNLYLIDGGEAADRGGAGGLDIMPSLDSIAEFRVMTSNYSADYGLSSGGTMTMAVKSGQKDLHASAWEFNRNNALDATPFFSNKAGTQAPELRFNTYGFNVGGPVTFGKLYNKKRDRTFFFYNPEWRKLIQGGLLNQTVPTTAQLGGNFGSTPIAVPNAGQISPAIANQLTADGLTLSATNCGTTGNPACSFFPNNTIPANLINPNSAALLAAGIFPAPNNGTQFIGGANQPVNLREEILRIDHRFSDKFSIFGHYMKDDVSQTYGTSLWSGDNVPTVGTVLTNPAYHYVVHATYSITPTILNEVAYNQNGNVINIVPKGVYQRPSDLNISRLFGGPNNDNRIPGISISGSADYDVSSWPWHNKADDYQIRDDLSIVVGSHQMKMGGSWALYKKAQDLFGNTQGAFGFNGLFTGNSTADFLLGYASSYTELAVQDHGQWNNISPAVYFQDNWHVSSRFTVNLGLRWDGIPHTYEANNRGSNFYSALYNPAAAATFVAGSGGSVIAPTSPGLGSSPNPILAGIPFYLNGIGIPGANGIPKTLVKSDWNTFGPRIGFAYDIAGDHKTVIRGGFGSMYERIQGNDMYNGGPNQPFSASVTNNNVDISNPGAALATGVNYTAPISVGSIQGLSYSDYKPPVSYQYSVGMERQLAANTVLNVSYVGNQERHQSDNREINLPNQSSLASLSTLGGSVPYNTALPYLGYHQIQLYEDAENGHYNGLQVTVHSQIGHDLTLQGAYTFSKAYDQGTGGDLAGVSDPYNRAYDNGPSVYDRRQIGVVNFIYDLPVFRNSQNKLLKGTLGGWEVSGIVTIETGLPLNITLNGSQSSNGLPDATNRPDYTGSISYLSNTPSLQYISTSGFSSPTVGAWGTLGRGVFYGPGRDNWNLSMFKSFTFSESRGSRIELRVETYNSFNHTEFNGVSTGVTFNSNGTVGNNFGQLTSTWDPRVIQLGGKFIF
jgi:hypothetical protein